MSKAFTKESDNNDADDANDDDDLPKTRGPRYITRQGYARLREELDHLWHGERPRVTAEVQAAAAQGDRSENAEYIYGKKRLREIDRRIRYLSKRLELVVVVEPQKEQEGAVYFGAWVTIEDEDEVQSTFRIVGVDEIDLAARHFSVESPMAKALLGKRVGEQATVTRPKGQTEVTVIHVRYELPSRPG
jgi:transcription elongation factor GreB